MTQSANICSMLKRFEKMHLIVYLQTDLFFQITVYIHHHSHVLKVWEFSLTNENREYTTNI